MWMLVTSGFLETRLIKVSVPRGEMMMTRDRMVENVRGLVVVVVDLLDLDLKRSSALLEVALICAQ